METSQSKRPPVFYRALKKNKQRAKVLKDFSHMRDITHRRQNNSMKLIKVEARPSMIKYDYS